MKFSTKAIHTGQEPDESTGAVSVPIYQTSTYAHQGIGKNKGYDYSRAENPTRSALEKNYAALEGATHAFVFSSGLSAIDAVLRTLSAGDHVVAAGDMYGGTYRLFSTILTRFKIEFSFVDMMNTEAIASAVKPNTKMIYTETPSNPMMMLTDLRAVAAIGKKLNVLTVVDNTFATPYLQNPIALGFDASVHSTTKYLGGHSDLIGGAVMTSNAELAEKVKFIQYAVGAVPSPFECWLLLRSSRTLAVRMRQHCENAREIAKYLSSHPKIKKVYYPGLASHPQHELAKTQMRDFGAMVSFDVGSLERAQKISESVRVITFGESLGGVESLLCHPATMTHGSVPKETREKLGITDGLLRLSVGIEDVEDLIEDLNRALGA
ncbi:MAG TPA: PLP-dependent aspartate aminotransferase family protein [Candidatus Kapabacteria bacterium]|nr:PLP-dependent aspartate aminotransferase family protein [Candidatus Kapabacteria bacterium]